MFWKNRFADQSFLVKILFLLGTSFVLTSAVAIVYSVLAMIGSGTPAVITSVPFSKGLFWIQAVFAFILPSLLVAYLISPSVSDYLYMDRGAKLKMMLLCLLAYIFFMPVLSLITEWNQQIQLPEFMSGVERWLKESEAATKELMDKFMSVESVGGLLMNILLIGVITGIAEEMMFRGMLQRIFFDRFKNAHLAVWITAAIFSAIHFEFYAFFPRLLMGAFFGYALVWTGSLYIPIFLHAFNNTVALVMKYQEDRGITTITEFESVGTNPDLWAYLFAFTAVAVILTLWVYKQGTQRFKYGES